MTRRTLAASTLPVALPLLLAGQPAQPQKPGFRSGVTLVEVDVVVTDKSGRPVRGLSKADFDVFEDDRLVESATFAAVDVPDVASASTILSPPRSGSAFASNERTDDGRLILIVLDDIQVDFTSGRMATIKSVARRVVERLGPADLAGVITTSGRVGGQAEFTTDKSRLLDAIERYVPLGRHELPSIASAPPSTPDPISRPQQFAERKTLAAMAGLTAAARALGTIPHRRKGVLLLSQGFPASLEEILKDPIIGAAWESVHEFMTTAQRNNVAVYTVDPCGLELNRNCNRDSRQNLRSIAEMTGGFATTNTNAPEAAVDRILAENGSYYLIGYDSPAAANDGKHHRIKVRTRIPDVEVRAREGYDAPTGPPKRPTATPLDALTAAAIQAHGLTMRVVAIPAPLSSAPSAAVIVGIELLAAAAARARSIEFAVIAIDEEGKTRARVRFTTNFGASPQTTSSWTRTGSRIDVPPGRYQIRVAALGKDQSRGSVFTEVAVPTFDTELGVGGLSLGAPSAIAVTAADRLRGVLALIPLTTNEIAPRSAAAAQLPVKVSAKAASTPLTIVTTLVRADGTTVTLDRTEVPGRDYAGAGGKVYRVALPPDLGAGTYRLVVDSMLGRTSTTRELTFVVLPG